MSGHSGHPRAGGPTVEEVLEQVGITYRELDHWLRTGNVRLDCQACATPGSGRARWFTPDDIERLRAARMMRDEGWTFAKIRSVHGVRRQQVPA